MVRVAFCVVIHAVCPEAVEESRSGAHGVDGRDLRGGIRLRRMRRKIPRG